MRVLVTGAGNPFGAAVANALAEAGHEVRAFGVPAGAPAFANAGIATFPGDLATGGSMEPVAAQCQAIVHCANLDASSGDKARDTARIEAGTRYARYCAERELVSKFIAAFPSVATRGSAAALKQAEAHVAATRAIVPHHILHVADGEELVRQVTVLLGKIAVPA